MSGRRGAKRAQGAFEYLLLIGGSVLVAVVVLMITTTSTSGVNNAMNSTSSDYMGSLGVIQSSYVAQGQTPFGCVYSNPACASGQTCSLGTNLCGAPGNVTPNGCGSLNPPCPSNYYCLNNTCYGMVPAAPPGCLYGNPVCSQCQSCAANNTCISNLAGCPANPTPAPQGCIYSNPACPTHYTCWNNYCLSPSALEYGGSCAFDSDCASGSYCKPSTLTCDYLPVGAKRTPCIHYGDLNFDGYVNASDADLLASYIAHTATLTLEQLLRADANGVNGVNSLDSLDIASYASGSLSNFTVCATDPNRKVAPCARFGNFSGQGFGDINGDGVVSSADATLAQQIYAGSLVPTADQAIRADVTDDGIMDATDAARIGQYSQGQLGSFTVCSRTPPCARFSNFTGQGFGDVDGDGYVTATDASLAMNMSLGLYVGTSDQLIRGDVSGDGCVLSNDALIITLYGIGLDSTFPICSSTPPCMSGASGGHLGYLDVDGDGYVTNYSSSCSRARVPGDYCQIQSLWGNGTTYASPSPWTTQNLTRADVYTTSTSGVAVSDADMFMLNANFLSYGLSTSIFPICGGTMPVINGTCGSSNGQPFVSTPSSGLCSAGVNSTVVQSGYTWSWFCNGSYNGLNVSCSAVVSNGTCGPSNGLYFSSAPTAELCSIGTNSNVAGSGPWTWFCNVTGGGTNTSCSASLTNNAACGSRNGSILPSAPTTNLCSNGINTTVTGSGTWHWFCNVTGVGSNTSCMAYLGINGSCGTANTTFTCQSTWSGTFCANGTASPSSPSFPSAGNTVSWACIGVGRGTNASCSAKNLPEYMTGSSHTCQQCYAITDYWTRPSDGFNFGASRQYWGSWFSGGARTVCYTQIGSFEGATTGNCYQSSMPGWTLVGELCWDAGSDCAWLSGAGCSGYSGWPTCSTSACSTSILNCDCYWN